MAQGFTKDNQEIEILNEISNHTDRAVHVLETPGTFDPQTGATRITDVAAASTKNVNVLSKGTMTVDISFEPYIQNQIGYYTYRLSIA